MIDIIITKIDYTKNIQSGVIELGISDHNLAYICRKIGIPKQEPKVLEIRQFKNFNIGEFQHDLTEAFRYFTFHSDPNTALHEWKEIFYQIADFHASYIDQGK